MTTYEGSATLEVTAGITSAGMMIALGSATVEITAAIDAHDSSFTLPPASTGALTLVPATTGSLTLTPI